MQTCIGKTKDCYHNMRIHFLCVQFLTVDNHCLRVHKDESTKCAAARKRLLNSKFTIRNDLLEYEQR